MSGPYSFSVIFAKKGKLTSDQNIFVSVNKHIVSNFRVPDNLDVFNAKNLKMQIPTPLEFSLYVLTEAEKVGVENLNPHWQSQWGCCPFCTLDFDIIGHLETFKIDMDFIIKAMHWEVSRTS